MIRWKAVLPLSSLLGILALLIILGAGPVLKWGLKSGGETVLGARVDIGSVSVRFAQSAVVIRSVEVADKSEPMKNLLEFGEAVVDFESLPLLEKKVIIDLVSLTGLRFATPRKSSGALHRVPEKPGFVAKASQRLWSQVETFSLQKLDTAKSFYDPKTVVNPAALKSVQAAQGAKEAIARAPADIQKHFQKLDAEKRAADLRKRVEALAQGGSGAEAVLQKVSEARGVERDLSAFKADIEAARQQTLARLQSAQSSIQDIQKAREEDWQKIRSTLSLPSLDKASISRAVFGPSVAGQLEKVIGWIYTARQYMPAKAARPPPPPRGQGRVIEFPRSHALPRFLLKKAVLSGEAGTVNAMDFEGAMEGLTSNPPLYGKPAVATLKGAAGARALQARLILDYTKEAPKEQFQAMYAGFPLKGQSFGQTDSLGLAIGQGTGRAEVALGVSGEHVSGKIRFNGQNLKVNAALPMKSDSPAAQRLTASLTRSLAQVSSLEVGVDIGGTLSDPSFSIQSSLGDLVSGALKSALGGEIQQQEQALRAELDKQTDGLIRQLQGQLAQLQSQVLPQFASQNKVVDDLLRQAQSHASGSLPLKNPLKGLFGK